MISQPAMMCLTATWQSLTGRATPSAAPVAEQRLPESALAEVIEGEVDALSESLFVTAAASEDKNLAAEGRDRDAAVLRARVHSTFRPKPLRTRKQVVLSR